MEGLPPEHNAQNNAFDQPPPKLIGDILVEKLEASSALLYWDGEFIAGISKGIDWDARERRSVKFDPRGLGTLHGEFLAGNDGQGDRPTGGGSSPRRA